MLTSHHHVIITASALSVSQCPMSPLLPVSVQLLVALAAVEVAPAVLTPHTRVIIADDTPGQLLRLRLPPPLTPLSDPGVGATGVQRRHPLLQLGLCQDLHQNIFSSLLILLVTGNIFLLFPFCLTLSLANCS